MLITLRRVTRRTPQHTDDLDHQMIVWSYFYLQVSARRAASTPRTASLRAPGGSVGDPRLDELRGLRRGQESRAVLRTSEPASGTYGG